MIEGTRTKEEEIRRLKMKIDRLQEQRDILFRELKDAEHQLKIIQDEQRG